MDKPSMTSGALSGVRILDATRILAGPWATQIMADLGADVIKLEKPGVGDDTRAAGPPFVKDSAGNDTSDAAYFTSANRGKRSVCVDISKPEGQAVVRQLAMRSDVFIENYKFGTMKRYGLDYETLRQINPRLIYCSITGFGQTGPDRSRPGYDFIFQGMGGVMSITGERDDLPGGGPQKVGVAFCDIMTGMYAAVAILGAIAARVRTGRGQYIDLALLDVTIQALANMASNYLVSDRVPGRMGNAHANLVPYQVFPCADGHIVLTVGNDEQFASFCAVANLKELSQDPRFATNPSRIRNRGELIPIIEQVMLTRGCAKWLSMLENAGVSCGPINNIKQALESRQAVAREMVVEVPYQDSGKVRVVGSPLKFSDTPVRYGAIPTLGQHTEEVLRTIGGLTEVQFNALKSAGVV
ncbi:CaiB/BaiF CoA transferase family protein [Paraburkholderia caribensis]|uniref:CaiB/BaiF CoA transferase family protein n=1 Tax=Paraburkholderia caribensis TaxID=75105 RepID=UPI001CB1B451|nr:CaiB/BaiF CoA-transferase family protein [Paraburkholderia caribensis]CAG9263024.1 Formyl-CoA transferase [Paraburkholderia caribensis]